MIEHTHNKSQYAVRFGRTVVFMTRPDMTRQKKYREPVVVKKKRFPKVADAVQAANHWEGILV